MLERRASDVPALEAQHQLCLARDLSCRRARLQPAIPLVEIAPLDLVPGSRWRPRRRRHWLPSRRMVRRVLPRGDEEEAWIQLPPNDVRDAAPPSRPQGYRRRWPLRARAKGDPRVDKYDDATLLTPSAALAEARMDGSLLEQVDVPSALPLPAALRAPWQRLRHHIDKRTLVADALGSSAGRPASLRQPGRNRGSPGRRYSLAVRRRLACEMAVKHYVSVKPRAPQRQHV